MSRGQLHIVKKSDLPSSLGCGDASTPRLTDAVNCVRTKHDVTAAALQIQQSIQRRIARFDCSFVQYIIVYFVSVVTFAIAGRLAVSN